MKNILVGQSGGPTAVINASLCGVIREARRQEQIGCVYGMINGVEGFLEGRYVNLSDTLDEEALNLLEGTPAAYLGSCRYKLPEEMEMPVYRRLFERLHKLNIGYFLYIGGNDSMDTVDKLSRYARKTDSSIRFIGVPKTIDNDLVETDHTPGYGSAAKYVAATVRDIVLDASVYEQQSVTIVELMGRNAGWLTAASALARKEIGDNPVLIYLPEVAFDMEKFIQDVREALKKRANIVVCVSEGIADAEGSFICEYGQRAGTDNFGHKMLAGCGKVLENAVRSKIGVKARSVELNVCQRCAALLQSAADVEEAENAGAVGVQAALAGETGRMVAFKRTGTDTYGLEYPLVDVGYVCNQEKKFPLSWLNEEKNDVTRAYIRYALPLIQGEREHCMQDGLPRYLFRKLP